MSDKTDALFTRLTDISEKVVLLVEQQNKLTEEQSRLLSTTPSRRYINMILSSAVIVLAVIVLASYRSQTALLDEARETSAATAAVAQQNQGVVSSYCAAQPELPECTNPGSVTAKATTMQTNCRIYATLKAVPGNKEVELTTDKACKAIGF